MSIRASAAPDATFFPLAGGGPVLGSSETTVEGAGTVVNLPPDKQQVFTLRDEGQQLVVTSTISFFIHGAAMNHFTYYPRNSAMQKWVTEAKRQKSLAE
jgi:hypothetical protein